MNKTNTNEDGNRIKFIIAVMTKDYQNAEALGKSILEKNPCDNIIRQYMTLIQNANFVNKIRESDSDLNEESTSESGESDSDANDVNDDLNLDVTPYKIGFHSQKFTQSANTSHLRKKFNFEKNVYRVLSFKLNKKTL